MSAEPVRRCGDCGTGLGELLADDSGDVVCLGCYCRRHPPLRAVEEDEPCPLGPPLTRARFAPRPSDLTQVRPVRWAWAGYLPRGVWSLLVGEEGIGKGTILAWMIAALTRGELPGDLHGRPARVLIVGDEDGWQSVVQPRLHAAGADLAYVHDLPAADDGALLDLKADAIELRDHIRACGFDVVVFDALLDNLAESVDDWKAKSVRAALAPVRRVAQELDVVVLGSLHANKGGGSFRERVQGSHAFNALSRSSLYIGTHPHDRERRVLVRGKGNYSKRPPSLEFSIQSRQLEVNGHGFDLPVAVDFESGELSVEDVLRGEGSQDTALADAERFLRGELAGGPVERSDLEQRAKDAEVAWRTVERARKTLRVISKPKGWWRLPDDLRQVSATPAVGGDGGDGGDLSADALTLPVADEFDDLGPEQAA